MPHQPVNLRFWGNPSQMDRLPGILRRLSEIEAAIGVLDYLSIRRMVIETQDHILELQREMLESSRLTTVRAPMLVKSGPPEIES